MSDRLDARIDHVAVAVPDPEVALRRWRDELSGGEVAKGDDGAFRWQHIRFANRGRLELLSPSPDVPDERTFIRAFLRRYGTRIHHCTLKVDDLAAALTTLREQGVEPVDIHQSSPSWHEMFLRPSVVGGLVVQVGHQAGPEDGVETPDTDARADAPELLGPRLQHPDLGRARWLWELLGAEVTGDGDALLCRWPRSRLEVLVQRGEPAGPAGLRMRGGPALPAEEGVGPAVEAVPDDT